MTLVLRLGSAAVSFGAIRSWTDETCRALCGPGLPPDARAAVVLAVHETVANVVEHAGRGAEVAIELSAEAAAGVLRLRVAHDGCSFARAAAAAPVFDGTRERGFGLFLTEVAVDRVEYGRADDGRACVWLEKRIGEAAAAGEKAVAGSATVDRQKG